jgi:hypothetical protein
VSDLPDKYSGSRPQALRPGRLARKLTRKGMPADRTTLASPFHIAGVLASRHPFRPDLFARKPYKVMIIGRWPPSREMESLGQALVPERAASATLWGTPATGSRRHGTRKTTIKFPARAKQHKISTRRSHELHSSVLTASSRRFAPYVSRQETVIRLFGVRMVNSPGSWPPAS